MPCSAQAQTSSQASSPTARSRRQRRRRSFAANTLVGGGGGGGGAAAADHAGAAELRAALCGALALLRLQDAWAAAARLGDRQHLLALANRAMEVLEVEAAARVFRRLGDASMVSAARCLCRCRCGAAAGAIAEAGNGGRAAAGTAAVGVRACSRLTALHIPAYWGVDTRSRSDGQLRAHTCRWPAQSCGAWCAAAEVRAAARGGTAVVPQGTRSVLCPLLLCVLACLPAVRHCHRAQQIVVLCALRCRQAGARPRGCGGGGRPAPARGRDRGSVWRLRACAGHAARPAALGAVAQARNGAEAGAVPEISAAYAQQLEFRGESDTALRMFQQALAGLDDGAAAPAAAAAGSTAAGAAQLRATCATGVTRCMLRLRDVTLHKLLMQYACTCEAAGQWDTAAAAHERARYMDVVVRLCLLVVPAGTAGACLCNRARNRERRGCRDGLALLRGRQRLGRRHQISAHGAARGRGVRAGVCAPADGGVRRRACARRRLWWRRWWRRGGGGGAARRRLRWRRWWRRGGGGGGAAAAEALHPGDALRVARYYETQGDLGAARRHYAACGQHHRALKLLRLLQRSEAEAAAAMDVVGRVRNDMLAHHLIDYLMGEADGVFKDPNHIYRLHLALGNYQQAAKMAIIIARQEQVLRPFLLLHSYTLARRLAQRGDSEHEGAARMLLRVARSASRFPAHGRRAHESSASARACVTVFEYASVRPEHLVCCCTFKLQADTHPKCKPSSTVCAAAQASKLCCLCAAWRPLPATGGCKQWKLAGALLTHRVECTCNTAATGRCLGSDMGSAADACRVANGQSTDAHHIYVQHRTCTPPPDFKCGIARMMISLASTPQLAVSSISDAAPPGNIQLTGGARDKSDVSPVAKAKAEVKLPRQHDHRSLVADTLQPVPEVYKSESESSRSLRIMMNIAHFGKWRGGEPDPEIFSQLRMDQQPYAQDNLAHARAQLLTALELCEMGAELVEVHLDCAYDCGGEPSLAAFEGSCSTPEALEVVFHQHDPYIGYNLTGVHRTRVASNVNNFDLFMYTEDDMLFTAGQILHYVNHQRRLLNAGLGLTHNVGFYRVEMNVTSPNLEETVFEETGVGTGNLDVLQLPVLAAHRSGDDSTRDASHGSRRDSNGASDWPWYVINRGNTYQGCWLLLQPQLQSYIKQLPGDPGPRPAFIRETNANWVFWQLNVQKFGVRHLGNHYLWTTPWSDYARSSHQLHIELLKLRARREVEVAATIEAHP
ncbi:hypothetical protein JKP88DRAFT_245240 [Tribonema minus]|uniref:Uncharacterized protein n=1 Tax=Tribonema minus TaxID=303371 RepID=A0A835YXQ0_9STRA|nr:hypothetical protein JKP88DRAFT_245240 [Tribonema minus]